MEQTTRSDYYDIMLDPERSMIEDQFYLNDLRQRKIYLNCEITSDTAGEIIRHILQFNADDKDIPKEERRPIILYINSPGGEVDSGFGLIDAIESSETPVYTVNLAMEYSMAFLIGLAGHKRFSQKNARFLMHDGSSFAYDSTSKVQDLMKFQSAVEARIMAYVLAHSRLTEEEYRDRYRVEWYMFADEAKQHGFCDFIIGTDCPIGEVI